MNADIQTAKERLPLPELMRRLDFGEHARVSAKCPFHEDQKASFSVWEGEQGWQWKCHGACQAHGDEIDFLEKAEGRTKGSAIRQYLHLAGVSASPRHSRRPRPRAEASSSEQSKRPERHQSPTPPLVYPPDLHAGTEADWRELAERRHLSVFAPARAAGLGTLRFATLFGFRCWLSTDERKLCAEARRMDGECFPPIGPLGERKAHTLKGSVKNWPVGLAVHGLVLDDFRAALAVEGGPDYLAALDFTLAAESDCLPIAFLGAGTASHLHPEALPLLAGRRIRFYPHQEASGAGMNAALKWAAQLEPIGCTCDAFDFAGLRRADGAPVKDLNDAARLSAEDASALEGLLP